MIILGKHTPRWIVFLIDLAICTFSIVLAYLLRFNFNLSDIKLVDLQYVIPFVLFIRALSFIIGKTYAGIIRYTSIDDAKRIFFVILSGSLFFVLSNFISLYYLTESYVIPLSIIIIDFISSIFILTASRLFVKIIYMDIKNTKKDKIPVALYGTERQGLVAKSTLERDEEINHKVVAFLDNTKRNVNNKLEGTTIYNIEDLEEVILKYSIEKLVIAKQFVGNTRKREIIDICLKHDVQVLTIPDVNSWINGELSYKQIKSVSIEDLLGREEIKLDKKEIKKQLLKHTILVTGAAGSIGSEIVRQLTKFNPEKIILYDQAESQLYELELQLTEKLNFYNYKLVIGNVTDKKRLENCIKKHNPSVIYHAAAYKHVPVMESNPYEAVKVNILGTKNVADLADKYKVNKFVMISTDKAVNPTNIMGASKRIAEIYAHCLNDISSTNFIITRFGNVLGSNGSVIPRFKKQIESGGPITITHPEVTRFFMTIPEACLLVLEAGSMGKGGEVYLFDMGRSVRIMDLAKKMIKLSGLTLGTDINIKITGLRPGEKLYEELLFDKENSLPTHHDQILRAKIFSRDFETIKNQIKELEEALFLFDDFKIVELMKNIVPEFKSKNSEFEILDNDKNK